MDILKNNIVVGLGIAVAATALAPLLLPVLGGVGRPLAKSLVKGGMALYDKGRESLALAGESLEDLMAEIRADDSALAEEGAADADGAYGAPPGGAQHRTYTSAQGGTHASAQGGTHAGAQGEADGNPRTEFPADGALYRSRGDGTAEAAAQSAGAVGI